ncbi:hypothetical protein ACTXT7_017132 [Hymenolepis weldensis]
MAKMDSYVCETTYYIRLSTFTVFHSLAPKRTYTSIIDLHSQYPVMTQHPLPVFCIFHYSGNLRECFSLSSVLSNTFVIGGQSTISCHSTLVKDFRLLLGISVFQKTFPVVIPSLPHLLARRPITSLDSPNLDL